MKKSVYSLILILMVCLLGTQSTHAQHEIGFISQPPFEFANQSLLSLDDQINQIAMGNYHSGALTQNGRVFFGGTVQMDNSGMMALVMLLPL